MSSASSSEVPVRLSAFRRGELKLLLHQVGRSPLSTAGDMSDEPSLLERAKARLARGKECLDERPRLKMLYIIGVYAPLVILFTVLKEARAPRARPAGADAAGSRSLPRARALVSVRGGALTTMSPRPCVRRSRAAAHRGTPTRCRGFAPGARPSRAYRLPRSGCSRSRPAAHAQVLARKSFFLVVVYVALRDTASWLSNLFTFYWYVQMNLVAKLRGAGDFATAGIFVHYGTVSTLIGGCVVAGLLCAVGRPLLTVSAGASPSTSPSAPNLTLYRARALLGAGALVLVRGRDRGPRPLPALRAGAGPARGHHAVASHRGAARHAPVHSDRGIPRLLVRCWCCCLRASPCALGSRPAPIPPVR